MTNSQYGSAEAIVSKIRAVLGEFKGYRALHADGRLFCGWFQANAQASDVSRAAYLSGEKIPITARLSKGGGDPFAHFGNTVGMAIRFYLPNGRFTNIVTLSQKLFVVNSMEQLQGMLDAGRPDSDNAGINKAGLAQFIAANPNTAAVIKMRRESLAPVSFATTAFHAVHAFRFLNDANEERIARIHFEPVAGIEGRPVEELSKEDTEILFEEINGRIAKAPVSYTLVLQFAEPGDPINDATAPWPEERPRLEMGRLTLMAPITEEEIGDPVMNHDPTVLTDGIEPTDDPILQMRRGIYEVSAAQRTGGWHACPFAHAADGLVGSGRMDT
jgi:catalase